MSLIRFTGTDRRTYVVSDSKSNEVRANYFKNPQKNIYEVIFEDRKVRVSKSTWNRIIESLDHSKGGGE